MHYHGYFWRGSEARRIREEVDGHVRGEGFASSDIPPIKTCWWLRRPEGVIAGTWSDASEAVHWMAERYGTFADALADPHPFWKPKAARRAAAARHLADGRDISWSYHLRDDERAFVAAVCCSPNAWEDIPCPFTRGRA
ncbi:hypothetical protein [Marinactinospora rubrisoli]|uniref:Uncharacterized protein n=1 Tax=Marinactinospora rubrisoli TaxID=2715399 RepID=A0ABW2KE36_9ACTN